MSSRISLVFEVPNDKTAADILRAAEQATTAITGSRFIGAQVTPPATLKPTSGHRPRSAAIIAFPAHWRSMSA